MQGERAAYGLLPRKGEVTTIVDGDPGLGALRANLEEWRTASRAEAAATAARAQVLARRHLALVEAYGRGARELAMELKRQWERVRAEALATFVDEAAIVAAVFRVLENARPRGKRTVRARFATLAQSIEAQLVALGGDLSQELMDFIMEATGPVGADLKKLTDAIREELRRLDLERLLRVRLDAPLEGRRP